MIPYYKDDLVTLFHGDARESFEWTAADVLVFDPPYGGSYESGKEGVLARSIANDTNTEVRDDILARWDGPALVFGARRIPEPEGVRMFLVWDKGGALGMGDLRIPWKPGHEEIYVVDRNGLGPWTGPRTNDVLCFPPVQSTARNGRRHPNEKPVPLMCALIEKTVGTVGDPTAGAGSTLVAAKRLGRSAIGFELDERYCEIIATRCQAEVILPGFAPSEEHAVSFDLGALA